MVGVLMEYDFCATVSSLTYSSEIRIDIGLYRCPKYLNLVSNYARAVLLPFARCFLSFAGWLWCVPARADWLRSFVMYFLFRVKLNFKEESNSECLLHYLLKWLALPIQLQIRILTYSIS